MFNSHSSSSSQSNIFGSLKRREDKSFFIKAMEPAFMLNFTGNGETY